MLSSTSFSGNTSILTGTSWPRRSPEGSSARKWLSVAAPNFVPAGKMRDPKDERSTYRKRARRVLEKAGRSYWCVDCGRSPTVEDAPGGHYPGMGALQADHLSKDISDCDPANLEWRCASCHKESDSKTAKGVSALGDQFGYERGYT